MKTLIPFCIEDRAYLVRSAPVVCFSPHRSLGEEVERYTLQGTMTCLHVTNQVTDFKGYGDFQMDHTNCMYGVMSSSVHFSRRVKRWLKRSTVSSERSSTRSRQMVSGREVRSTRARLWKIHKATSTAQEIKLWKLNTQIQQYAK